MSTGKKKARFVAKGYAQRPGEDYHESFSPVVQFNSIRLLAALAAEYNMEIHQMDVVTAYLNEELKEDVYMSIPEGFEEFMKKLEIGAKIETNHAVADNKYKQIAKRWLRNVKQMQNLVCMIIKALYGLLQSGLRWYEKLTAKLQDIGSQPTEQDPCLFFRRQEGRLLLVTIYVEDL